MNIEQILVEETRERIRSKIEEGVRELQQSFNEKGLKVIKERDYDFYRNRPILTVDAIVLNENKEILLISRKNPPHGWALPGGLVDYGETVETAVARELIEETSITPNEIQFFKIVSEFSRDPRFHAVSIVYYIAEWEGTPKAADDAKEAKWFSFADIQDEKIAFDHKEIISDFFRDHYSFST